MKRELLENVKVLPYTSGDAIDREGYLSAVVAIKAKGTGDLTITVTHSDEESTNYVDVPDPYLVAGGAPTVEDVAADDVVSYNLDLVGCKKYIKIDFEGDGEGTGATVAVVLGDAAYTPVTDAPLGE